MVSISAHGGIISPVSLLDLFIPSDVVSLVIPDVPCHPDLPSSPRRDGLATIFRNRSRAAKSILLIEYNLPDAREGGRLRHPCNIITSRIVEITELSIQGRLVVLPICPSLRYNTEKWIILAMGSGWPRIEPPASILLIRRYPFFCPAISVDFRPRRF